MSWATVRLLAWAWACLWLGQAAAAAPAPTALRDDMGTVEAHALARHWADPQGLATLQQVLRLPDGSFEPAAADGGGRLPAHGAVWLKLRLQRPRGERQHWVLKLPMPLLDLVTVYQQDGSQWRSETAGDTVAVNRWPERGRYPLFRLDLPAGETRDVYLRIQHSAPTPYPLELATEAANAASVQAEFLTLGAVFGALLLLIASCLAKGWAYRDPGFAWYAGYAAFTTLATASYTGVAAEYLWPGFGLLQDAPTNMLACTAVGAAVLFVRKTLGLRRRLPVLDRVTLVLGIAGPVVALLPAFAPKEIHLPAIGIYICLASVSALAGSATAWWRGDAVARWVFAAQFPLVAAVVATVTRNLGWTALPYMPDYVVVLALAVEVPLLLVALFIRSRDRHSAEVREQALSTHDALTGLLAPHLFTDRLRQVVTRFQRNGENAAVMYIDLVNHARIRDHFTPAVAEQSVLRSVIKLRRLLRDVDTVARVGEARFGVILEGATSRASVSERATRLIANGMMPLPGLKPDVTLQFHVAALMLGERPMEAADIETALAGQLARMSPRTRRPIRFIQGEQVSLPEVPDSTLFPQDIEPPAAVEPVPSRS